MVAALHDGVRTFQRHASAVCDVVIERTDQKESEFGLAESIEELGVSASPDVEVDLVGCTIESIVVQRISGLADPQQPLHGVAGTPRRGRSTNRLTDSPSEGLPNEPVSPLAPELLLHRSDQWDQDLRLHLGAFEQRQ